MDDPTPVETPVIEAIVTPPPPEVIDPPVVVENPELVALREDMARQKAEIARLTRLTSLQGGTGPGTPPTGPRRFEDLSQRDMESELRRMASVIDGF